MAEPSPALMELVRHVIDQAAESLAQNGGPMVPFVVTETSGDRSFADYPGDMQQGLEQARATARTATGADRAAVAWDGYLLVDGQRSDAVLVEASEAGDRESVIVAQRYGLGGRLRRKVERWGEPEVVERGQPLF